MIHVRQLSKRYGDKTVVDNLEFTVAQGVVTGFLGPNGAGKSTTMRMIVGLDRPTAGSVTINGRSYADIPAPLHEVGALLEARSVHTGRTAYNHLRVLAATHGISSSRVLDMIDMVGLTDVAGKRAGAFSLGMGQRLGIAATLLGDPGTLILDEPVNGLDPDGILWIRNLLRSLAAEGRTVLISSHLMSEMALTAEHLIVIGKGKLIADLPIAELISAASRATVLVRSPRSGDLRILLTASGLTARETAESVLEVSGTSAAHIGDLAAANGIAIHELTPQRASLEDAFMELTSDAIEFHGGTTVAANSGLKGVAA
ncbi:MAG: ATP-binding cassette domain-containing protein [Nakamurella sp.]